MTKERILDLMNKGYITQVIDPEVLSKYTEAELIEKGYITQIGIFDGVEDTTEEVPVVDAPVVDDEPVEDEDSIIDPDNAPVVDDGMEDEIVAEGDTDAGIVEG